MLSHYIAFIIWELPCTNFGIGDIVTGTTPVAILKKQPYQFYYQMDKSLAPSGRIHFDWRICTSLVWHRLWENIFVLRFDNVVSTNFCIQMESNQDSTSLAQQVQALATTVEELTR